PRRSASSIASAVFPLAVGPTTQTRRGFISSLAERLELRTSELRRHRAPVRAVGRHLDAVHRTEQRLHLGGVEALADAHDRVTRDGRQRRVDRALGCRTHALLDQLRRDGAHEPAYIPTAQETGDGAKEERRRSEGLALEPGTR